MAMIGDVLIQHQQRLRDEFMRQGRSAGAHYAALSNEQWQLGVSGTVDAFVQSIVEQSPTIIQQRWITVAQMRAEQGFAVDEMQAAASILRRIMYELLADVYAGRPAEELAALKTVEEALHMCRLGIAQGYERYREQVRKQMEAEVIQGSAPTIPIYQGILVMPLIGHIDNQRAVLILETLLETITQTHARVAILDITGISVIDTHVANYLIQATRAVRLLGADVVLTGMSPTIAQTVVQLGIDLGTIITRADLEAGLHYALGQLGRSIELR